MASALERLHQEVLINICCAVGVHALQQSRQACKKLHRAWQLIVRSVRISYPPRNRDIPILAKFTHLETLIMAWSRSSPSDLPPWRVLSMLDASFTMLRKLAVYPGAPALRCLHVICTSEHLQTSLQELALFEPKTPLEVYNLRALTAIRDLRKLELHCDGVNATPAELQHVTSKLTSLRDLSLNLGKRQHALFTPDDMEIFPGSITNLTGLTLLGGYRSTGAPGVQQSAFTDAISALTNLRSLSSNYAVMSEASQHQSFSQLALLTSLSLHHQHPFGANNLDFEAYDDLPALQHLHAPFFRVDGRLFTHLNLKTAIVRSLNLTQHWRNTTAEDSKLEELRVNDDFGTVQHAPHDDMFENFPLLPHLHHIRVGALKTIARRYLHLGNLLRKHANTLRSIALVLLNPFEEPLPELSRLTSLTLRRFPECSGPSHVTMMLLAMTKMPALEHINIKLQLNYQRTLHVETDLGWLRGCTALKRVHLELGPQAGLLAVDVAQQLNHLLVGRDVEIRVIRITE